MSKRKIMYVLFIVSPFILFSFKNSAPQNKAVETGQRYDRLVVRNVIIINGNGTPASGPMDVIIAGNKISEIRFTRDETAYKDEPHIIDGTDMYLLPGLINIHAHIHEGRAGHPIPFEYIYKLWLGCGITTVRDVGSNYKITIKERTKSQTGEIAAPRIFLYMTASGNTPDEILKRIQDIKKLGADGLKIFGLNRDIMKAALDEAHELGLRVAHHAGVEEIDAWDDAEFGTTSIEHWYGIPDAALRGSQNFPPWYNYNNENDRFRYAGHLWREADPKKLEKVLQMLIKKEVAWDPTFAIYEACRDLQRAQNQPWFKDYLYPAVEEFFIPNPNHHGSFQWNWTTTDEVFWRENYQLWMKAVRDFAEMGGIIGVGEDAGYIYVLYGFGLIRELELQQEAGFHPIDVIQHATGNNAKILGMEDKLGQIKVGYFADLILIDGNPLENFKFLYPTRIMDWKDGKIIYRGGVQWTIKDGYVYHAPTLLEDVRGIVAKARQEIKSTK